MVDTSSRFERDYVRNEAVPAVDTTARREA